MKTADEFVDGIGTEELAWVNLCMTFRRACALYHKGDSHAALRIASEELPALVEHWGELSGLNGSARRLRLMSMFVEEGRKAGEGALAQKMFYAYTNSRDELNRETREILRTGGGLSGGIRRIPEVPRPDEAMPSVPLDFDGDIEALQMIRG
jgi:hypothetical protein